MLGDLLLMRQSPQLVQVQLDGVLDEAVDDECVVGKVADYLPLDSV
jgi:hypothetical protein